MESSLKIDTLIAANNLAEYMSMWFTNFIATHHVQTGLMRDVTRCGIMSHAYNKKQRIIWSLNTTDYFSDVEKRRKETGKDTMMKLVKQEEQYAMYMDRLRAAILKDYGKDIIKKIKE